MTRFFLVEVEINYWNDLRFKVVEGDREPGCLRAAYLYLPRLR